jgi:hypothetical protein
LAKAHDFQKVAVWSESRIAPAHRDARQFLVQRPLDVPPKVAFPPEPWGVPVALRQELLDAQASSRAQVQQASPPVVLRQALEQAPWEQSWVRQALLSVRPLLVLAG